MIFRSVSTPRDLGAAGERRASRYYRARLYSILARNLRDREGEIDLVVRRGRTVVFVEVKTRQQRHAGAPHEAVTRSKQLVIAGLADRFLRRHDLTGCSVRFDVLSLFWNGRRFEVEHFADAFRLETEPAAPWRWK